MNLMDLCPISPLEIPSAIPTLGMTLPMAITKQDIETLAVLIRKNAEKMKGIVILMLIAKLVSSVALIIVQVVFHHQPMTAAIKVSFVMYYNLDFSD